MVSITHGKHQLCHCWALCWMCNLTELLAWLITISSLDRVCVQLKHKCHHLMNCARL